MRPWRLDARSNQDTLNSLFSQSLASAGLFFLAYVLRLREARPRGSCPGIFSIAPANVTIRAMSFWLSGSAPAVLARKGSVKH